MRTLGVRAQPATVNFVVYDECDKALINVETLKVPSALNVPEGLKYVRTNILDILREYDIRRAGIRITEPSSKNLNIRRIQVEGIIQEAFASSCLELYFCGQIANISALLGFDRTLFKKYISNQTTFDAVERWGELNKYQREAVLAAMGAANA